MDASENTPVPVIRLLALPGLFICTFGASAMILMRVVPGPLKELDYMVIGTVSALLLIYLSPAIQVDILKHAQAWFPLRNPGIVTIPLSFLVAVVVSVLRPVASEERGFVELERQVHLGVE